MSLSVRPYHALVWFRDDLRTDDHPALTEAIAQAKAHDGLVSAVYILDDALWNRSLGGASRWWLHHSLAALSQDLAALGISLTLRRGPSSEQLCDLVHHGGITAVLCNRGQTPFLRALERTAKEALSALSCPFLAGGGELLAEPNAILTGSGQPYRVFTPFWKRLSALPLRPARPEPEPFAPPPGQSHLCGLALADLGLLPHSPDWAGGLREAWQPGQAGARQLLAEFLSRPLTSYASARDFPASPGTSRLSPHLRFGELSPRRLWDAALSGHGPDALPFLREVGWREFNHHLLFQWPTMATDPLKPEFNLFPWRDDPQGFTAWCQGKTGFAIVDAGQRQLWVSGWMHNRVRMISASFLVKDLLIPWQQGEAWMWDTLVDACPANNPGNWQWVSGCGADAAPYFRIFNPQTQGEKFDPRGEYQRRWLPERYDFGAHTPRPIVDHAAARNRALAALAAIKGNS